jgi:hypothetical protein
MIHRLQQLRRATSGRVALGSLLMVGTLSFAAVAFFPSSAGADPPTYNLNGNWNLSIHNCANVTKPHAITVTNFSSSTGDFQVHYVNLGVSESFIGVESGTSVNLDGHVPNGTAALSNGSLVVTSSRACADGNTYSYILTNSSPDLSGSTTTTTTAPGTTTTTLAPGTDVGGVDVANYCSATGGTSELSKGGITGPNYAYNNWECSTTGTVLSMQQVCTSEYGSQDGNVIAKTTNPNSANGWNCYIAGPDAAAASAKRTNSNSSSGYVSLKTDVPSVASKLSTPGEIFHSPTRDLENAVITVGAMLFITFPANIFNQTFSENYEEILVIVGAWRRRFRRLFGTRPSHVPSPDGSSAVGVAGSAALSTTNQNSPDRVTLFGFIAVLVLGSLFGGLLDPRFGMNRQSLVSFGATLVAFTFGAVLAWLIARTFRRRHQYPTQTYWRALPVGLAIALVCVLISRFSHFEPGYLYGVVVSVAFVGSLKDRHNAHLITISTISTLSVAVLAWLAWIPFNHLALEHGSNFIYGVIDDALASIFIGGIVGTVVGLIPLRGLPGENLSKWRKDVWALVFFVALFLLIEVELHPASGPTHTGAASLVTVIVLFVLFGGSTIAMRAFFAKRHAKNDDVNVPPSVAVSPDGDEHPDEGGS